MLEPITVYIVDDDVSVRQSMGRLIRSRGWQAEGFASAAEFLDSMTAPGPGCVLLDYQMPGMNGLDLQQNMADRGIDLPLVFLSGYADIPVSVAAMKHGAADFLVKPVAQEVLFNSLEQAIRQHGARADEKQKRGEVMDCLARLSGREKEVLYQVVKGRLNKQVAYDLGIAEKTVKVHRARIMEKMEAGSLADLVRMCYLAEVFPLSG